MTSGLIPTRALGPSAFYSLYLGALEFEGKQKRRACTVVLAGGRLGLRPGELQHLHEGWVDWDRGEIHVPARDPCACTRCWEAARQTQRAGDGRDLATIVAETQWSPAGGPRSIPFGYSGRLTAVLAELFEADGYLGCSADDLAELVAESARRATGLDENAIDIHELRATAATFFADAGFDATSLAGVLGVDPETARQFTQATGGHARQRLYEAFGEPVPDGYGAYPLVADPDPFEDEPFDPREYDADWRASRAATRTKDPSTLRNPRPDDIPDDVEYDFSATLSHLDVDSSVVATDGRRPTASTLSRWVESREAGRGGTDTTTEAVADSQGQADAAREGSTESGSSSPATDGMRSDAVLDPRERATDPVVAQVSTTFACSDLDNGTPLSGEVVLGQQELVVADGNGEVCRVIEADQLTDISVDYSPPNLEDTFDSSVGIAYDDEGTSQLAVIELPGKKQLDFSRSLFTIVLSATPVVATHPAREGGRVIHEDPEEYILTLESRKLEFIDPADGETAFGIRLSDVIYVERGRQTYEGDSRQSLLVRHLRPSGQIISTDVATQDDDKFKPLERFVMRNYSQRKEEVNHLDLTADQKEVLVALYSTGDAIDVSMILDHDAEELSDLLDSLQRAGLVRKNGDGTRLTGSGQMVVSDKVDDVNT